MEITVATENSRVPVTVIRVKGNLDTSTFESFLNRSKELIADGARHILVDLEHVPYMSSAGLRALNAIFNQLRALNTFLTEEEVLKAINEGTYKSPDLKLLNISKQSRVAFETAGFDMFLETFTNYDEAVKSF